MWSESETFDVVSTSAPAAKIGPCEKECDDIRVGIAHKSMVRWAMPILQN